MPVAQATALLRKILGRTTHNTATPHRTRNYWEQRYAEGSTSGSGSYGSLAQFKASFLNDFVAKNGIESVLEIGCGDGNQLTLSAYPKYVGVDLSETAVKKCTEFFKDDPTKSFYLDIPPSARERGFDLCLSLDVIFHLVEEELFERYMRDLFQASRRWVIIYSSNCSEREFRKEYPKFGAIHVRHRKFTKWVEEFAYDWKLVDRIPNAYPFDPQDPERTSFADFYIFENRNLDCS